MVGFCTINQCQSSPDSSERHTGALLANHPLRPPEPLKRANIEKRRTGKLRRIRGENWHDSKLTDVSKEHAEFARVITESHAVWAPNLWQGESSYRRTMRLLNKSKTWKQTRIYNSKLTIFSWRVTQGRNCSSTLILMHWHS